MLIIVFIVDDFMAVNNYIGDVGAAIECLQYIDQELSILYTMAIAKTLNNYNFVGGVNAHYVGYT